MLSFTYTNLSLYQLYKFIDLKHGSWIFGGGWNNDLWGGELPMASWIDDITYHNPVRMPRPIVFSVVNYILHLQISYFNALICRCG